jgi:hypothetical protein
MLASHDFVTSSWNIFSSLATSAFTILVSSLGVNGVTRCDGDVDSVTVRSLSDAMVPPTSRLTAKPYYANLLNLGHC